MLQRRVYGGAEVEVLRASLSDALRMTSFCVLVNCETTVRLESPEGEELRIGDFTEDGGACGAGGGGEVGGALVEGFVGEEGEGVGFFGLFGDGEFFGGEDVDWGEGGF